MTTHQQAALALQAQALATAAAQQCPAGSPVLVRWQERQADLTPGRVIGHRVEIEADADAAAVRVYARIEYRSRRFGRTQSRYVSIDRVQLQDADGSDHTTA